MQISPTIQQYIQFEFSLGGSEQSSCPEPPKLNLIEAKNLKFMYDLYIFLITFAYVKTFSFQRNLTFFVQI